MKLLELSYRYGFLFLFYLITVCVGRSEKNLVELVLFFHLYVGSWDRTQVVGCGSRHYYPPSHLISPTGEVWSGKWMWHHMEYGGWNFQGTCGRGSPSSPFCLWQLPRSVMCITFRSETRKGEGAEQPSVAVLWRGKRFLRVSRGYWEWITSKIADFPALGVTWISKSIPLIKDPLQAKPSNKPVGSTWTKTTMERGSHCKDRGDGAGRKESQ